MTNEKIEKMFGRINEDGNVDICHEDGSAVTRLDTETYPLWPVGSNLSSAHEHPDGLTITRSDAGRIGLEIE